MNRIEGDLLAVWTITCVEIAAPMRSAVFFWNVERSDWFRNLVGKPHKYPWPLKVLRPVGFGAHKLAVRGVEAMPIPVESATTNAPDFFLFTYGKLDRTPVKARARLTLFAIPYSGNEQLVASVWCPVEMAAHPAILETTAQFRTIAVHSETGRLPD